MLDVAAMQRSNQSQTRRVTSFSSQTSWQDGHPDGRISIQETTAIPNTLTAIQLVEHQCSGMSSSRSAKTVRDSDDPVRAVVEVEPSSRRIREKGRSEGSRQRNVRGTAVFKKRL
jgi:hypothetical protein